MHILGSRFDHGYGQGSPTFLHIYLLRILFEITWWNIADAQFVQNVVPISRQMQWFRQYKIQLEGTIGKQKARHILDNALYVVSSGSNDFVNNFYINPNLQMHYNVTQYMNLISTHIVSFLQVSFYSSNICQVPVTSFAPCIPNTPLIRKHNNNSLYSDFYVQVPTLT